METTFSEPPPPPIKGNMAGGPKRPWSRRSGWNQFDPFGDGGCLINRQPLKRDGPDSHLNLLYKISHSREFPHFVITNQRLLIGFVTL